MTSGIPLNDDEIEYIVENKEMKFIRQMANELGISNDAVRKVIKEFD